MQALVFKISKPPKVITNLRSDVVRLHLVGHSPIASRVIVVASNDFNVDLGRTIASRSVVHSVGWARVHYSAGRHFDRSAVGRVGLVLGTTWLPGERQKKDTKPEDAIHRFRSSEIQWELFRRLSEFRGRKRDLQKSISTKAFNFSLFFS